jgi:hypothetical protein
MEKSTKYSDTLKLFYGERRLSQLKCPVFSGKNAEKAIKNAKKRNSKFCEKSSDLKRR